MNRETSAAAYAAAIASGQIRGKRAQVLSAIITHGPATSAEIVRAAGLGANLNLVRARFTELTIDGAIEAHRPRRCSITGRAAIVWDIRTSLAPLAPAVSKLQLTRAIASEAIDALTHDSPLLARVLRQRLKETL